MKNIIKMLVLVSVVTVSFLVTGCSTTTSTKHIHMQGYKGSVVDDNSTTTTTEKHYPFENAIGAIGKGFAQGAGMVVGGVVSTARAVVVVDVNHPYYDPPMIVQTYPVYNYGFVAGVGGGYRNYQPVVQNYHPYLPRPCPIQPPPVYHGQTPVYHGQTGHFR